MSAGPSIQGERQPEEHTADHVLCDMHGFGGDGAGGTERTAKQC